MEIYKIFTFVVFYALHMHSSYKATVYSRMKPNEVIKPTVSAGDRFVEWTIIWVISGFILGFILWW